ncbi:hypothetical protein AB1Y20_021191 [Prymnesium parvum]|uniref:Uncharacterized protein n=1 Tax=Prymnesium parvum TaxID=97485 RepID=A0AB34JJX8_PRYPA
METAARTAVAFGVGVVAGVAALKLHRWRRTRAYARLRDPSLFAFYSSVSGRAPTTDLGEMTVPIDDHLVVRGHAVFDTVTLRKGRLYRLRPHLERLFASASAARIPLPYGADLATNLCEVEARIRETVAASGKEDADVRYWLTAGPGNLGVTPDGCTPALYVLVFGGLPSFEDPMERGLREVSVPASVVAHKPAMLAEVKSSNYMLNALTAMAARDKGGCFGIGVRDDGTITESAVLNVVLVGADGILRTPPFEGILRGTTVRRAMELAEESLVGEGRLLKGVRQCKLTLADAAAASELMLVAGDTHVMPVTMLDGKSIGSGQVGPVAKKIAKLLEMDADRGDD